MDWPWWKADYVKGGLQSIRADIEKARLISVENQSTFLDCKSLLFQPIAMFPELAVEVHAVFSICLLLIGNLY